MNGFIDTNNVYYILPSLGFEEEDLYVVPDITEDQLIRKYLDISRRPPYNLHWNSVESAISSPEMLGVYKQNGVEYRKHDIVQDTINYFYYGNEGGSHNKKRKTYKRKHKAKSKRKTRQRY
jgi:hypothetical protein